MSLAEPQQAPERKPSPVGLTLPAASRNPFRNPSASSPAMPSPAQPASDRPVSRNPFLANFEQDTSTPQQSSPVRGRKPIGEGALQSQSGNGNMNNDDLELFDRLTLGRAKTSEIPMGRPPQPMNGDRPRVSEDGMRRPLPPGARGPPQRRPVGSGSGPGLGPQFPSGGERRPQPRERRNSESSIMDRPVLSDEERRRKERRRREEYERRKRAERGESQTRSDDKKDDKKDGERKTQSSSRRLKPQGFDIIDKLDVTGIYGSGMFHHDGPFDACNPHRNRKRDQRAPIQAFPAGSANMAMGGYGPVNKTFDVARYHGYADGDAHDDYGVAYKTESKRPVNGLRAASFDPTARAEPIHGEETMGLGTSTFLEGAPASRKAIQRRESETEPASGPGVNTMPGLSRKKSLAQRIRGISAARPRYYEDGGLRSPEARYGNGPTTPGSPPGQTNGSKIPAVNARRVQSAASSASNYKAETNPFDQLYDEAYEQKGASIRAAEKARAASTSGPSAGQNAGNVAEPTSADRVTFAENKPPPKDVSTSSRPIVRTRALSSPRRGAGLDRIEDEEGVEYSSAASDDRPEQAKPSGGKLLSRMKSLKGGSRNARRPS